MALRGELTQVFWDALQADKMSELFGSDEESTVEAVTDLCYVDGQQFHEFKGAILGRISKEPRGPKDLQWDCVFIPDKSKQTFAEMRAAEKICLLREQIPTLAKEAVKKPSSKLIDRFQKRGKLGA
jgi:XTP/dITP diphosphohydrolase